MERLRDFHGVRADAHSDVDAPAQRLRIGAQGVEFHGSQIAVLDLGDTGLRDTENRRNLGLGPSYGLTEFLQVVTSNVSIQLCGRGRLGLWFGQFGM
ncbi:hypothetical protein AW168_32190 [Nocardia brasiliensis]|uniref:Uncharacterized protein n=1 Tax=Nocardia brasiliensis (strain ATCC 700358 / HUJEG-1) TaxID=1133849 RepID=K0F8A6_NOCB7|nr:hypothetical protein O3I_038390 [Nocardia brasiliensis ATCC 700358]OCF86123.1 hypothetical protein AW168_32190 [Nocardia brasiliensis]